MVGGFVAPIADQLESQIVTDQLQWQLLLLSLLDCRCCGNVQRNRAGGAHPPHLLFLCSSVPAFLVAPGDSDLANVRLVRS
jgi:hypothetical protein